MVNKNDVITSITNLKTSFTTLDDTLMEFLSSQSTYGVLKTDLDDFVTKVGTFMTNFSAWKVDSTFKVDIEIELRKKIFKLGSIVSMALNGHKHILEGLQDIIDEADPARYFSAEHAYLQRALEKKAEDLMIRVNAQVWKLDKLRNILD